MLRFFKDKSYQVIIQAYKQLGKFIYTLRGLTISPKLLKYYFSMCKESQIKLANRYEIPISCAYHFPAVLQTIGMKE